MKRVLFILLLVVSTVVIFCSCNSKDIDSEMIIVEEFGYTEPTMSNSIADVNNIEAVTELSSQVVLCTVKSLKSVSLNEINLFSFRYEVEILDIYMDTSDVLQKGDTIEVLSSEGLLKASKAAELVAGTERAKKYGILQDSYSENEYIRSSTWNAIPIEVGKTYIMYLEDEFLEDEGVYAECGYSFLYQITDDTVYGERTMTVNSASKKQLISDIKDAIKNRTGRADEVGDSQYMTELGELQNKEATY